jgi:hypothetical protein
MFDEEVVDASCLYRWSRSVLPSGQYRHWLRMDVAIAIGVDVHSYGWRSPIQCSESLDRDCGVLVLTKECWLHWLNYVKSPSIKENYESWKPCNTWESFHVCESFTKIFEMKNKSEYINDFYINLWAILTWSNMFDTIRYLYRTPQTRCNLWPDMSDLGRTWPTLVGRFWETIFFWLLRVTLSLVDHEIGCVGKLISLAFHACEEHPNQMLYVSCASI